MGYIISNRGFNGDLEEFLLICISLNIAKVELELDKNIFTDNEKIANIKSLVENHKIKIEALVIWPDFKIDMHRKGTEHIDAYAVELQCAKLAADALKYFNGARIIYMDNSYEFNEVVHIARYASKDLSIGDDCRSIDIGAYFKNTESFPSDEIFNFVKKTKYYNIGPAIVINGRIANTEEFTRFLYNVNNCELKLQAVYINDKNFENNEIFKKIGKCYFGDFTCTLDVYKELLVKGLAGMDYRDYNCFDHTRKAYPSCVSRVFTDMGIVKVSPEGELIAGTLSTWTYEFTAVEPGIKCGGGIRLRFSHSSDWKIQLTDKMALDYCSLDYCGSADIDMILTNQDYCINLDVKCKKGCILPGEKIKIIIGDKKYGSKGSLCQTFEQKDFKFFTLVDVYGNGFYKEIKDVPAMNVIGGKPEKIKVIVPSIINKNKEFKVKIRVEDKFFNRAANYEGRIELKIGEKKITDIKIKENDNSIGIVDIKGLDEGIYRIEAVDVQNNIRGRSNPAKVVDNAIKQLGLYWGDIHGHTALMDGIGTADEYYQYGRDVAFLDICSLTEHVDNCDDVRQGTFFEQWDDLKNATKKYNEPGKFVTILGYECSQTWDANIYYGSDDAPCYVARNPADLINHVKRFDAIMVPHMTSYPVGTRGYDWQYYWPELMPVVEIYSNHGSSERFGGEYPLLNCEPGGYVVEALDRGCKYGFIGSSDGHDGRPGNACWGSHINGLVALYSEELDRNSCLEAIKNKYCYATTNERIILNFMINDAHMGETIELDDKTINIIVEAYGTNIIDMVEIIKNGRTIYTFSNGKEDVYLIYTDEEKLQKESYYYVKIKQADGNIAWSSPIFVGL